MKKLFLITISVVLLFGACTVMAAAPDGATGPWADTVVDYQQGTQKNGNPIDSNRSDPSDALGPAETPYNPGGSDVVVGSFFSLGLGIHGWIILGFDNCILNEEGEDVEIIEETWETYPPELIDVFASQNSDGPWTQIGDDLDKDSRVDLGSLPWAKYIKIVDVTDPNVHSGNADGYDLDGVRAMHSAEECPEEPCPPKKQISVGNDKTLVVNNVTVISNTGGNGIANSQNQMGGFSGNISSGNWNNTIRTGDATAKARIINVVNSNITRNSDCCGPKVQVSAGNDYTGVDNTVFAGASTGENGIANSDNQMGGFSGNISSNNDGNRITTGNANAYAGAINLVNSNVALGGDCCGPKVQVSAGNDYTFVRNEILAVADTGGNSIAGSKNMMGGFSGNISSNNDGNVITTGNATTKAGVINIVNSNIIGSWGR